MSFRSCHCCQEPGRVFVWIVSAMTVTKVVEGCVYICRRYYGILPRVGGEFEHSALSPLSLRSLSLALSSNATTLNHLIRLRGSQGVQIWKQRTWYRYSCRRAHSASPRGSGYEAHECGRPSVLSRHRHQAGVRLSEHPSADRSEQACGPDDCDHRALPPR